MYNKIFDKNSSNNRDHFNKLNEKNNKSKNLNKFLTNLPMSNQINYNSNLKPSGNYNTEINKSSNQAIQHSPFKITNNIVKGMFSYARSTSPYNVVKKIQNTSSDKIDNRNNSNLKFQKSNGLNEISTVKKLKDETTINNSITSSKIDLSKFKISQRQPENSVLSNGITIKDKQQNYLTNYRQYYLNDSKNASKDSLNINIANAVKDNINDQNISQGHFDKNQSNTYSEITNSRTYYDKKLDENAVMKYKSNNPIVYNNYHDFENRRMTLELTKLMLKNNPSYHNDPKSFLSEVNVDFSLLELPSRLAQKYNSSKLDKFILNPFKNQKDASLITSTSIIESSIKQAKHVTDSFLVKQSLENVINNSLKSTPIKPIPNLSSQKTSASGFNLLLSTHFKLDEESNNKMKMLYFLISPKVVFMIINDIKTPTMLKLIPTNLCYHGLENYILEYEVINSSKDKGNIDLLKINHATQKSEMSVKIVMETETDIENYEFFVNSPDDVIMYVSAINYVSQLVKCKVYANKGNFKHN